MDIMHKANADPYLTIHPFYDNALEKIHAVQYRKPGDPHPYVIGKDAVAGYLTVASECAKAVLAGMNQTGR